MGGNNVTPNVVEDTVIKTDKKHQPPLFTGGNEALQRYFKSEVNYPKNQILQGYVFLKMRIDERGHPFGIIITKSMGKEFDEEAIRVIKNMPSWEPQIENHTPVKSSYISIAVPFFKSQKIR